MSIRSDTSQYVLSPVVKRYSVNSESMYAWNGAEYEALAVGADRSLGYVPYDCVPPMLSLREKVTIWRQSQADARGGMPGAASLDAAHKQPAAALEVEIAIQRRACTGLSAKHVAPASLTCMQEKERGQQPREPDEGAGTRVLPRAWQRAHALHFRQGTWRAQVSVRNA